MATKHTQGEWVHLVTGIHSKESGRLICQTWYGNNAVSSRLDGNKDIDAVSYDEYKANSKLICEAPALLANLKQCAAVLTVLDPENPAIAMAEHAIKKATE